MPQLHNVNMKPAQAQIQKNGVSGGTRTHYPQFRKLLLYPDELRRHVDIMYKTRQNILQAKFFLPPMFSAQKARQQHRSASPLATPLGKPAGNKTQVETS